MTLLRTTCIGLLLGALVGCGHGFEGEFEGKIDSGNAFVNAVAGGSAMMKVTIGPDYIESDGQRKALEDIFVRGSGDDSYLVLKAEDGEQAWKIIDDDTLLQDHGMVKVRLERVE
jgi:hypothetical protein